MPNPDFSITSCITTTDKTVSTVVHGVSPIISSSQ
jgi:hypothetical protein